MSDGARIAGEETHSPRAGEAMSWSPRRMVQLDQAFRRSKRVFLLRRLFAAAALVAALGLVAAGLFSALGRTGSTRERLVADDTIRMLNPRFTGRSTDGKLFIVTAEEAIRRNAEDSRIELKNPEVGNGVDGQIRARTGVYDLDKRLVALKSGVELEDPQGNLFSTEEAIFRIDDNYARGDKPVKGSGPIGDVSADSFEIIDGGRLIKLRGNVRAIVATDSERERRNAAIVLERAKAERPAEALQNQGPNTPPQTTLSTGNEVPAARQSPIVSSEERKK